LNYCAIRLRTTALHLCYKSKIMTGIGKKIERFCNTYFKEAKLLTENESLTVDEGYAIQLYLIDKIVESFSGIGKLLELSDGKNMAYLKNPVSILLRGCLSDIILLYWIIYSKNDDELKERIMSLRKDHIKYHISYLRKMDSFGLIDVAEKNDEIDILNTKYVHLLDNPIDYDFSNYSFTKSITISQMLDDSTKVNPAFVEAYKTYSLFSKIEHFGELTRMIIEENYKEDNNMHQYYESAIFTIEKTIMIFFDIHFKGHSISEKLKRDKIY
jgi:hypothetical protein